MASQVSALRNWTRTALPPVVDDAPGTRRALNAAVYLFAFAVAFATLVDTWESHPGWLRPISIAVGVAGLISLRWRRTHTAAVAIVLAAGSTGIITLAGPNYVAAFNAAVRARGRDLAIVSALMVAYSFSNPILYPPDIPYGLDALAGLLMTAVAIGWGLFLRARRALSLAQREQADAALEEARAAERRRIAREMHDVLAHRL
jgi:signal transduction histidine kinase